MNKALLGKTILGIFVLGSILAGCSTAKDVKSTAALSKETTSTAVSLKQTVKPTELNGELVTLTAEASNLEVEKGTSLPVWTFNNSVPGPQIRIKKGKTVNITVKNQLTVPISLHIHGYPLPFKMDGVPGITQNAIAPGKSFTYTFKATVPGTYWYHSHQDSVNQIDKGLYGSFVVEDDLVKADRDYTLMLDEWMSSSSESGHEGMMNMSMDMNMPGMDHSSTTTDSSGQSEQHTSTQPGHDMSMYDLYTINGQTYNSLQPLQVTQGDTVRLRLINAGYLSHSLHLHGHRYRIIATDGNPVSDPKWVKDKLLSIAPGERVDIEFQADNPGTWYLEEHGSSPRISNMKQRIQYTNEQGTNDQPDPLTKLPTVDLTNYGKSQKGRFSLNDVYDVSYTMNLGTRVQQGKQEYTINNKVYPDTEPLSVQTGDKVKVRFVNTSANDDHPMHLHGHTFQVLSKNGIPLKGSPVYKDTLNVKPGEEYIVAFTANNPGDWMFHCHDLHHASAGMVTDLKYNDFQNTFQPDPNLNNTPE
ncbi:multicopper oxidase family protein [Paenibacillus kribbensis]|uniref:multicopper oxidase family protein n=1 Tax=Paenibacillus kribbensis TaxID=172713 RepID=UPI0015C1AB85|nr:multicopper oxidase family protein [Paenibacillus kribbensis]